MSHKSDFDAQVTSCRTLGEERIYRRLYKLDKRLTSIESNLSETMRRLSALERRANAEPNG